ncbi:hypothetical protein WJX84_008469 [Apatococcus fuscideae]|uniref:Uncharacterized protein n=1 Tax=Apatococcus fuscideae TaxID=2026836 RepID=A0AAW1T4N3_9CHLO
MQLSGQISFSAVPQCSPSCSNPSALPTWKHAAAGSFCRRPAACRTQQQQQTHRRRLSPLAAVAQEETIKIDVTKMQPLGDRILVEPQELEQKSSGGLILTSSSAPAMQDAIIGKVVAVGSAVSEEVKVKVGDNVLYSKYSTSDVETAGGPITFVAEKSILAVLS